MKSNKLDFDVVIIGAGVIGLSIARLYAQKNYLVLLIEQHEKFGQETSSRNSEVLHAGLYYKKNSLKGFHCVRGKELMYEYCNKKNIPHKRLGKLIVSQKNDEFIDHIIEISKNLGVFDLKKLSLREIQQLESEVTGSVGLFSPSSGIIDSHLLMSSLLNDFELSGGVILYSATVKEIFRDKNGFYLEVIDRDQTTLSIQSNIFINCAGLHASKVAEKLTSVYPLTKFCKGSYFHLKGQHSFKHLVYPTPEKDGLGIHLTLDMNNLAKFGPDTEWVDTIDYSVDISKKKIFVDEIKKYWPNVTINHLGGGYSGIRPKIFKNNQAINDFWISSYDDHGIEGLINVFGIESPGLTATLSLAEYVFNI